MRPGRASFPTQRYDENVLECGLHQIAGDPFHIPALFCVPLQWFGRSEYIYINAE